MRLQQIILRFLWRYGEMEVGIYKEYVC